MTAHAAAFLFRILHRDASFPTMTTTGKQQTSFPPPPPPQIKSGEGGEIAEPHPNDVLCGRGGRINSHEGNIRFRDIVATLKPKYLNPFTKKVEKALIAAEVVAQIRSLSPPGRFLKETNKDGMWEEIGDDRARKKAGQALREDAPDLRAELSDDVIWSGEGAAINGLQRMVNMQQLLSPAAAGLGMIPQQSMYGAPTYAGYGQGNATDTQYSPDNNFFNTPNVVYSSAPFPQYYTQTVHQNQAQSYLPPQQWAYNSQTTSVLPDGTSQPMSQYQFPQQQSAVTPQLNMQQPSANRRNILNKFFTENEQQDQQQKLQEKQAKSAARNRGSVSSSGALYSSATSSDLEYLDNVSLSNSGNWILSNNTERNSLTESAFVDRNSSAMEALDQRRSSSGSKKSGMSSSSNSAFVAIRKDRLSPIGDNGQEENISNEGSDKCNSSIMNVFEAPVHDDSTLDSTTIKRLMALTQRDVSGGIKRSNSFPNFSTLSMSDVDMFSAGESGFGEDNNVTLSSQLQQFMPPTSRRFFNVGRREQGSAISALSNQDSWRDADNEIGSSFINNPQAIKNGTFRAHRMRINSGASGGGAAGLFSSMGSDEEAESCSDEVVSDVVSNASSWLKPFKNLPSNNNEQFNPWQAESNRSILSDMSVDLMALDLASNPDVTFASYRAAAQRYQQHPQAK